MHTFIKPAELATIIERPETVVFDCRADLNDPDFGLTSFNKSHIPGAKFIDAEAVLTGKITGHGGRHPLPDIKDFVKNMEDLGVSANSRVISYGAFAARLFFMLELINIKKLSMLDGGFEAWQAAGLPVSSETSDLQKGKIDCITFDQSLIVDVDYVRQSLSNSSTLLIDCRSPERYRGDSEPIDPVAGHIPGAANFFWKNNFNSDGNLLPDDHLMEKYREIIKTDKEIILYCGSGVTACWNYAVFKKINIPCKIYTGSWSDWITYPENPVKTF